MGQSQTGEPDDSSCFRACIREKNNNSLKKPAAPFNPNQLLFNENYPLPQNNHSAQKMTPQATSPHKNMTPTRAVQTSIEEHLKQSQSPVGAVISETTSNDMLPLGKNKQHQQANPDEEGGILGLQSKFSSSRKTTFGKRKNITKITATSEGVGTRSHWQKEGGSSQSTNKSQGASTQSAKSGKVLKNKIEEIKQKYYERELQIEIYQNQHEYQEELDQMGHSPPNKKQEEVAPPDQEARDVSTIRQKILDKLNKRKMHKPNKKIKEVQKHEVDTADLISEELEIYSKGAIQPSKEEEKISQKKEKNILAELNQSGRSDNKNDVSTEDRVQFSAYSQNETLHEIKECDEEEEDYKSKAESKSKNSQMNRSKPLSRKLGNQPSLSYPKEIQPISRNESQPVRQKILKVSPPRAESGQSVEQASGGGSGVCGGGGRDNKILFF